MRETNTAVAEAMETIKAGLATIQTQMGSLDSRMTLMDNGYQQMPSQLDLHSRAVSDHTHVMVMLERRQESLEQQLAATAEAVTRIGGSKEEEEEPELATTNKGLLDHRQVRRGRRRPHMGASVHQIAQLRLPQLIQRYEYNLQPEGIK